MNRLPQAKRVQVVKALVEGNSIRSTVRMTGVAKNTIVKLLVELADACAQYQDDTLRGLTCRRVEADEIWAFCYAKEANVPAEHQGEFGYGDIWTWVAMDADTKLVISTLVGERDTPTAIEFMQDVRDRIANRTQLTTDGLVCYLTAVEEAFGSDVDYGQLVKVYGELPESHRRYSPSRFITAEKRQISGSPDPAKVSTSHIERQNLTMRMGMRRFTRLTNGFSKKAENLIASVNLHQMHYNFARPHKSLASPYPQTPAMAAGVADHIWSVEEIVALLD
ncbi:MAG: IS1 family transposase [Candidatus Dormiibacterota bacterium]|jgi:IS1 family transposase